MENLVASIDELYKTFAPYKVYGFVGCSHCVDPRESSRIASTPLRNLSIGDLDHYSCKAMTTWGSVNDFKHFLPRLFELATESPTGFAMPEVLFGKLAYGNWEAWSSVEVSAVDHFLSAFWIHCVQSDTDGLVDSVLCSIGNARSNMDGTLGAWIADEDGNSVRNLARFVVENIFTITTKSRLMSAHWERRTEQESQVIAWLSSRQPLDRLLGKLSDLADGFDQQELSDAISELSVWTQYAVSGKKSG